MLSILLTKIFGSRNDRVLRCIKKKVDIINQMEKTIKNLNDAQLVAKTDDFCNRIKKGFSIDILLPEAFAVVREASKRVFGMRHFDVQLMGGIVLNSCSIAEMRTGEGKTLTATLPAYLNALCKKGVHIVTVNDYLAKRDAENNRPLFEFLGLSVGINTTDISREDKRLAYNADITYGTNHEYGFDYLRDNMVFNPEERVQRNLHYAIIDEVDSILIDEARTPLIISGPSENSTYMYRQIDKLIPYFIYQNKEDSEYFKGSGHFTIDEKSRQINLTERGLILIEQLLVKNKIIKEGKLLYSSGNIMLMHYFTAALRAHMLFVRNVDYIIKNKKVVIVDEHTGRIMSGRRWSEGLHQAIEAKENLSIQNENQTLASITFQNYFRMYKRLSGMTGTADTEAFEFRSIYKLDTIVIPTNKPMIRKDLPDIIYMTEKEKIKAIIQDIKWCKKRRQPVLVGTISIEKSELFSNELKKEGLSHKVLNAKLHAMEAEIIAQAGKPKSVTIATNMAGRGTDIMLGGNWKSEIKSIKLSLKNSETKKIKHKFLENNKIVQESGGLHIIGTERHESRRIDNQLRGRAGRQGDPGSSRFYLSMEDTLMRIFASPNIFRIMKTLGIKKNESITHPWVTKAVASAQNKIERKHFEIRKQLLEYDDVANDQRQVIYSLRNKLLDSRDISETIKNIRKDVLKKLFYNYIYPKYKKEKWDFINLEKHLKSDFNINISIMTFINKYMQHNDIKDLYNKLFAKIKIQFNIIEEIIGKDIMRNLEKTIMLQTLDSLWKEHLAAMDYLRQGIHLRGYAQKDPKQEYKRESFEMFANMLESLKYEVISKLSKIKNNGLLKNKEIIVSRKNY